MHSQERKDSCNTSKINIVVIQHPQVPLFPLMRTKSECVTQQICQNCFHFTRLHQGKTAPNTETQTASASLRPPAPPPDWQRIDLQHPAASINYSSSLSLPPFISSGMNAGCITRTTTGTPAWPLVLSTTTPRPALLFILPLLQPSNHPSLQLLSPSFSVT